MLQFSLCNYSDSYILVKGNITVNNTRIAAAPSNRAKNVIFKNYARFSKCISEINNTQINNAKDTDIVIPMYNANFTDSFIFKAGMIVQTDDDARINGVEIIIPFKYLSNFWRTFEMP